MTRRSGTLALTALSMMAFAGNSLLCRVALSHTSTDPASFTTIRIVSGALVLAFLSLVRSRVRRQPPAVLPGSWTSALALVAYATCFSLAYVSLTSATGALLLFGAVQVTMIGFGHWKGERLHPIQWAGVICACSGVVGLVLPGLSAPPLAAAVAMLSAGCAWGIYSLRGKAAVDPIGTTTGNFVRAMPFAIVIGALALPWAAVDRDGFLCAVASGAITSGVGYAIWYTALGGLNGMHGAIVQLSVPVFAAIGGILFLGEGASQRLAIASVAILGGIALTILKASVPAR